MTISLMLHHGQVFTYTATGEKAWGQRVWVAACDGERCDEVLQSDVFAHITDWAIDC